MTYKYTLDNVSEAGFDVSGEVWNAAHGRNYRFFKLKNVKQKKKAVFSLNTAFLDS